MTGTPIASTPTHNTLPDPFVAGSGSESIGITSGRRPSPWHDIAHSLSTTSLPPHSPATSTPIPTNSTPPLNPTSPIPDDSDVASLSTSQALRDWDRLLAQPDSDVKRHALLHGSPLLAPSGAPKLEAEHDKEGHIEYKLKLIEPSPERFQKLVTQMMWRLKQGRNEAIYELGLADDGTVIGLTRAEMDASLRTLELMASEVGATVIVLKEIVLSAAAVNLPTHTEPGSPSLSSSVASSSGSGWIVRRPDLDEDGQPRKGTKGLNGALPPDTKASKAKQRRSFGGDERIILDDEDGDSDVSALSSAAPSTPAHYGRCSSVASEDDPPAFHLDLDDQLPPSFTPGSKAGGVSELSATSGPRTDAKRMKSASRREQRRLDLLRGDGLGPPSMMPYAERSSSPVAEFIGHAPYLAPPSLIAASRLPYQPARPSSLRLQQTARSDASPISGNAQFLHAATNVNGSADITLPDDTFVDGLLLPLDSLSLSFADVRTMPDANGTSPSKGASGDHSPANHPNGDSAQDHASHEDTYAPPGAGDRAFAVRPSPPGEQLICVEALVVRKPRHGGDGTDEWEAYGGEDDGWGFGG